MSETTRALIVLAAASVVALLSITSIIIIEIRRNRQRMKMTALAPSVSAVSWWQVLEAVIQALQPLPDADVTKLQQALDDLRKVIPPTQGEK